MQLSYAADLWRLFGISYLDQDRLSWFVFDAMTEAADRAQANEGR